MHWIYILENLNDKSWYIGYTSDLEKRIKDHQRGNGARTTRIKKDWKLIYCEGYLEKLDALGREDFLKSGSGRKFIKKQIFHYFQNTNGANQN